MTKEDIRNKVLKQRKLISQSEKLFKSRRICEHIISCHEIKSAKIIFLFSSFKNEPILTEVLKMDGKRFFLPVVKQKNIFFCSLSSQLTRNKFGILEPPLVKKDFFPDTVITPCLAVDKKGNRIGYGKGYYDRFFKKNISTFKIGVLYSQDFFDNIPFSKHDIRLDAVVSEKGIYRFE